MKDDLEKHSQGPQFLLEQWLNSIRFQRETNQDFINLERQFYQESFLGMHIDREDNLERRYSDCGSGRIGKVGRIRN